MVSAVKLYLAAYNAAQFAGWGFVLFKIGEHFANGGNSKTLYPEIATPLNVFQGAALLEVLHSLLGLVSSPLLTTAIQIASRLLLVAVAHYSLEAQVSPFLTLMATSWSITEVVRYLFYVLEIFKAVPRFLLWLRYSLFLGLYPSGVAGEVGTLYNALSAFQSGLWATPYFSFYPVALGILATYVPGLPFMYNHMVRQRNKKLGLVTTAPKTKRRIAPPSRRSFFAAHIPTPQRFDRHVTALCQRQQREWPAPALFCKFGGRSQRRTTGSCAAGHGKTSHVQTGA